MEANSSDSESEGSCSNHDNGGSTSLDNGGSSSYDNGARPGAPKQKLKKALKKNSVSLAKALTLERKRRAALSLKLKKLRADKKQLERSIHNTKISGHSTMREDHTSSVNNSLLLTSMNNLSFASFNVAECKPIPGGEEIDRRSFEQWKELLEASMQLVGVLDEFTKVRIFKIKAGAKLLDVLEGTKASVDTPDVETAPYSNAICRLKDFFGSRDYGLMQRQKLRSMIHNPGETDMQYVKRVVAAAKLCDFGEEQLVENVVDVVQLHASNIKVREAGRKVQRKGGSIADLLDKVRICEIEKLNEEIFAKSHQQHQSGGQIAAVSVEQKENGVVASQPQFRFSNGVKGRYVPRSMSNSRGRGGFLQRGTGRNFSASRSQCWRCTSSNHSASECHAIDKVCRNCERKGHLERACRQMPSPVQFKHRYEESSTVPKVRRIAAITEGDEEEDIKPKNRQSDQVVHVFPKTEKAVETPKIRKVDQSVYIFPIAGNASGNNNLEVDVPKNERLSIPNNESIKGIEKSVAEEVGITQALRESKSYNDEADLCVNQVADTNVNILTNPEIEHSFPNNENITDTDKSATEQTGVVQTLHESNAYDNEAGVVEGQVGGMNINFLIDSGADVNTINGKYFKLMMDNDCSRNVLFCVTEGTDKSLKAYATSGEINVIATFVAELFISEDRPRYMEKFYAIENARSLLSRSTALRYNLLQIGLNVPVIETHRPQHNQKSFPGEIYAMSSGEFPSFNVPPVMLSYDQTKPPSRNVFTNIPPAFKAETERRLNDLLNSGIIEYVTENMDKSFCSSLLVVPKGKDNIRLVVDLRGPNKCIIRTPFRMPTFDSILADLDGATWFSTIDLTSAFFHVTLHENSRHITNFFAGNATFRFKRLPFGLCNAPDIFQEILQTVVLAGCTGTHNYLDDILVHGKNKEEHDKNLEIVLRRLRDHNVSINKDKCVFREQSVKFLGFRLSHDGLKVEDDKLKAIRDFRRPDTQAEVKSFLGLMNFAERFIPKRVEKTEKLRRLAKSTEFYWGQEEENEFLFLKQEALKTIKRLGYFNAKDVTELYVDASPIGLGAILVQFNEQGTPRIIACAAKALTEAEKKYPQTQKEALAIVWAIERFTFYLTSKAFTVRTDCEANEFIFGREYRTSKRAVSRAEAWALRLQAYDFSIKRIPGHLNVADAVSRLIQKTQVDEPFDEDNDKHILYVLDAGFMNISWKDIDLASEESEDFKELRMAIKSGKWPHYLRSYEAQAKELHTFGQMLFKDDRILLPEGLRFRAIENAHQGHIGCNAMKRIMRQHFWWPGLSRDVEKFVKNCETCLVISRKNPPIPLCSRSLPEGPWEILQIDFLTVNGCGSGEFMVVTDTYSRYISVIPIQGTDTMHTNLALSKVFFTWGLPLIMQSDNGPPFQGSAFITYWEEKGVRVRKSIPLSPQTNGAVERQNQGITKALAGAKEDGINWKIALQNYVHVHNTTKPHSRLGVTPFELLVGWRYRGVFPKLWKPTENNELDRYDIREKDDVAKLISQKYADAHRGARPSDIKAGDKVVVSIAKRNKTDPAFSNERFTVLIRDGPKVVIRSDRGVQYTRTIQDIKRAPEFTTATQPNMLKESGSLTDADNDNIPSDTEVQVDIEEIPLARPRRTIRKPEKFKDMFIYNIFQ